MRTHIRYPLIASIILLLSILLLPGSSAKRRGAQPPASDKSSLAYQIAGGWAMQRTLSEAKQGQHTGGADCDA